MALYDPSNETKVSAGASSYGLGAVLLQRRHGADPVTYISRALTPTEQRYAQVEKEALAVTWACEHFKDFLIRMKFQVETDHKPLLALLKAKQLDKLAPRILRFRMRVMWFHFSIAHVPGKSAAPADVLSRAPVSHSHTTRDNTEAQEIEGYINASYSLHCPSQRGTSLN